MRGFEATSTIDASRSAIWSVLTDGAGWTTWDSSIPDLGPSFVRFANGLKRQVEGSTT